MSVVEHKLLTVSMFADLVTVLRGLGAAAGSGTEREVGVLHASRVGALHTARKLLA